MARMALGAALVLGLVATAVGQPAPAEAFTPKSKASVLQYLRAITGSNIVSGQHNKEPASAPAQYTQQVKDITGQYPDCGEGT